jgi:DNA polymerase-3 subunit beta
MTITLSRLDFTRALALVAGVVERRNTIPILSTLRLVGQGGRLAITGTDLDIEATVTIPTTGGDIAATAPAALLHDIVRKVPEGADIVLDPAETHLAVRAGRSRFKLQTLPAEDFPDLSRAGQDAASLTLPAASLRRLLAFTSFAISTEETRYYLNGVYLHAAADGEGARRLTGVATDGHRLARRFGPALEADWPGMIVPRKAVSMLLKWLDGEAPVTIRASDRVLTVSDEGKRLTTKLIDGTFPDYARVIPKGDAPAVRFDSAALAQALDRVVAISSERGRAVRIAMADGAATLSVVNPDAGSAEDEIEATTKPGHQLTSGYNARYLLDILAALDASEITLAQADPGSPALILNPAEPDDLTVLMPMRV